MSFEPAIQLCTEAIHLLDKHPLPLWIIEEGSLSISYCNVPAQNLYGFKPKTFLDLFPDSERSSFTRQLAQASSKPFHCRHYTHAGEVLSVDLYLSSLVFHEIKYIQVTVVDVTEKKRMEEKMALLANLVEHTTDILTAADLDYKPLTWNKAAENVYGLTAEQVIGRDLREFVTLHHKGFTREQIREIIQKDGEWKGEACFIRPSDQKLITLLGGYKLLKNGEQPLGILITGTDITERIEAEARLKESENRFREMADSAPVMIWMCNDKGITTYLNQSWINFTGADISFDGNAAWAKLVHPEDYPEADATNDRAFKERLPVTLVYRLKTHEGSYRWVKDVSKPRFLRDGSFIGYIGSVVDIEEQKRTEEQLRYQATILENVSDIIVTTDLDDTVRGWNKVATQYYEITEEEAIGRPLSELVQFSFESGTKEEAKLQLQRDGKWEGEVSRLSSKGERQYFLHAVKYAYDGKGNQMGYISVSRDITEKKKIEKQLQKSEQFYRALIADSLDGTILVNAEGRITFGSPSVKHVLGYETHEIEGRNGFEFIHPDDIPSALESFQRELMEDPRIKFISIRLLQKNGEWLWCMVRGHNLLKNPYVNSVVVYFHDDTLRKQAADALKESEKRFRTLVKDLQTGVLLQDAAGHILLSNNAMSKMFDIEEGEIKGKKIWEKYSDVIDEEERQIDKSERPVFKAIQTKKLVKDKVMGVWHPKKKERVWLLISADPILNQNGEVRYIVSSFINITERKKLEQKLLSEQISHQKQVTQATLDAQEAERREIGKELHDNIGQQLTTIKLFLDMAKSNATDSGVEMINMALKSVMDVINEIRFMSRSLIPHTLKDLGLVDSIMELTDSFSLAQSLTIHFDCKAFKEDRIPENQKLTLFRIVQEQLNNIVKHAAAKNIHIHLKNAVQNAVVLEINDDGQGFDPQTVQKGLGFTNICNRAELFGGKGEVVSIPGQGCYVKVTMPVGQSSPATLPDSYHSI